MKKLLFVGLFVGLSCALFGQKKSSGSNAKYFENSGTNTIYGLLIYPFDLIQGNYGIGAEAMVTNWLLVGVDAAYSSQAYYNRGLYGLLQDIYDQKGYSVGLSGMYILDGGDISYCNAIGLNLEFGSGKSAEDASRGFWAIMARYNYEKPFGDYFFGQTNVNLGYYEKSNVGLYEDSSGFLFTVNVGIGLLLNP